MDRRKFLKLSALFAGPAIISSDRLMAVALPPGYTQKTGNRLLTPSLWDTDAIGVLHDQMMISEVFTVEGVHIIRDPGTLQQFKARPGDTIKIRRPVRYSKS